jgi:serine/threonine protein kinase/Tol biopolymer transport system component
MSLALGTTLGPYEIVSPLGAGGMGEVYKARDTRINRVVAIKILPAHLANRPDLRERFEREARTIGGLNHPYICVLYDVGVHDGAYFLVMEHVEGETLAQRLQKGPLPLDQVLRCAREIADALDKAHRQGAIHRDIKPGNIMLTRSGTKLLDFGLAKLKEAGGQDAFFSQRRTESNVLTDQGTILGTLEYMAPEQVEGRIDELDARTDIFAFGAVIYEMVTGRKAFEGKSQASLIAAILKEDPPSMSSIQPMAPASLDHVVRKCLAKDPERRWQTASDLRDELTWVAESGSLAMVPPAATGHRAWRDPWRAIAAIAILAAAALAVPYLSFFRAPSTDAQVIRFSIVPPGESTGMQQTSQVAVAPDGTRVAFVAREGSPSRSLIWVRSLDSPAVRSLPGTDGATGNTLFWSPDGRFIGFVAGGKLKTVPVAGGSVQTLVDAFPRGGAWSRDGTILFTPDRVGGLARISSTGGTASPVTRPDPSGGVRLHRFPQFLPDGRHFLYFADADQPGARGVYVGSLDTKDTKHVLPTLWQAQYAAPGFLLFMRDHTLLAQPFDAGRQELSGEPSVIADGIASTFTNGAASFSVSEGGVLAYASGGAPPSRLSWFDRAGRDLGTIEAPSQSVGPELSPDDNRVAVEVGGGGNPNDIWLLDIARGIPYRLTSDPANERFPRWAPDGTRVLYQSDQIGGIYNLFQKPSSGAGSEEVVFQDAARKYPYDWSVDGKFLVYISFGSSAGATADIWVLPVTGTRKPFPFLTTKFQETHARIAPDVRWVAYVSDESGMDEVYVSSFPAAGGKVRVSTRGGVQPRWRGDGKELFYLSSDRKLIAVPVKDGSVPDGGVATALFDVHFVPRGSREPWAFYQYDVTGDGQRFLINVPPERATIPITVVLNWTAGLKK